jgi:hypothetical protein
METIEVKIRPHADNGEVFLYNAESFGDVLLYEYQLCSKRENDFLKEVDNYLQKNINEKDHSYLLEMAFEQNTYINIDFCNNLNRFDILYPNSLDAKNELGESMIWLCDNYGLVFIVSSKEYLTQQDIELNLNLVHIDYMYEAIRSIE